MILAQLFCALLSFSVALGHEDHSYLDRNFGPLPEGLGMVVQDNLQQIQDYYTAPPKDFVDDLQTSQSFVSTGTFGKLPLSYCYDAKNGPDFDIAIVGAPFDTGVSLRPGARFGPAGIRKGTEGFMVYGAYDPFYPEFEIGNYAEIVECGDVSMTPFDNRVALDQLYRAHRAILKHDVNFTKLEDGKTVPKIVTLGGDHTITFSALRALHEVHGPIAVLHFDSHIDTWDPAVLGGNVSEYAALNHGTFLHYAYEKGYIEPDSSMHVGIRGPYARRKGDPANDARCGFQMVKAREISKIGVDGIVKAIKDRIGDKKVYLSLDIDVLDPVYAPATGTAEPGGFTTREIMDILDELADLNIVGADVVEVSPIYDDAGEVTQLAAAAVVRTMLAIMASKGAIPVKNVT